MASTKFVVFFALLVCLLVQSEAKKDELKRSKQVFKPSFPKRALAHSRIERGNEEFDADLAMIKEIFSKPGFLEYVEEKAKEEFKKWAKENF